MSKTPAWYGQMWLIIIDFHLAFTGLLSLNSKDNWLTKKKKVPITMCTPSVIDGVGARVTWEIQFRRIRALIMLSWIKRKRSPPNHSMTQGMVKEHWLESLGCSFCHSLAIYIRQVFSPCWVITFSSVKWECSSNYHTLLGHCLRPLWSHLILAATGACPCSGTPRAPCPPFMLRAPHSPPALRLTCFLWCVRCHKTHWVPLRIMDREVKALG